MLPVLGGIGLARASQESTSAASASSVVFIRP
jgi:hypothetical protein